MVTMVAQLVQHPLPVQRLFAGVIQNVHLPKGQQNLAADFFHTGSAGLRLSMSKIVITILSRLSKFFSPAVRFRERANYLFLRLKNPDFSELISALRYGKIKLIQLGREE